MLQGTRPHEVLEIIRSRLADPRARPDRKVALVVEGGAMRGVYTGGALLGLHLLDATCAFDVVYGTSSGAVNAGHFLSGLGHLKAATYYKALVDGQFFHPWRLRRLVDIDFFVDRVLREIIPFEMERILAQPVPLMVALLNCTEGRGEVVRLPPDPAVAWEVVKACVAMPVVYNRTIAIDGRQYADGGLPIPFPLPAAISDGCTDILVLRSRDPRRRVPQRFPLFRWLYSRMFARGHRGLLALYDAWPATLDHLGDLAAGKITLEGGPNIATISPDSQKVKSNTMNPVLLRAACHQMARETLSLFGRDHMELDALIAADVV